MDPYVLPDLLIIWLSGLPIRNQKVGRYSGVTLGDKLQPLTIPTLFGYKLVENKFWDPIMLAGIDH